MLYSTESSDGVITKSSSKSVAQTIDGLRRLIADRDFTVFNVIDHSGVAERAGVQMPDSKLVMFGKPTVGAAVMLAAPLAALDIPLKVLVWDDRNGAVSVSYNSPGFWPRGITSRANCVRPSRQLSRSLRNYFVHNLRRSERATALGDRAPGHPASDRLGTFPLLRGARCAGDDGLGRRNLGPDA